MILLVFCETGDFIPHICNREVQFDDNNGTQSRTVTFRYDLASWQGIVSKNYSSCKLKGWQRRVETKLYTLEMAFQSDTNRPMTKADCFFDVALYAGDTDNTPIKVFLCIYGN